MLELQLMLFLPSSASIAWSLSEDDEVDVEEHLNDELPSRSVSELNSLSHNL